MGGETRLYQKVLLASISALAALAVLELAARRLQGPHAMRLQPSDIPGLAYTLVPGQLVASPYGDFRINDLGFRGEPVARAKPAGTFRAVVLGDSVVYGEHGAGADLSRVLERGLNAAPPPGAARSEVLNAGVPGYNSCQELVSLQRVLDGFAPDLVVVGYTMNDPEKPHTPFGLDAATGRISPPWRAYHWAKQNLALPRLVAARLAPLVVRLRGQGYYGPPVEQSDQLRYAAALHDPAGPYWPDCARCLAGFGDYQRSRQTPVVLALLPLFNHLGEKEQDAILDRVAAAARGAGLSVADFRAALAGVSDIRALDTDGMHPSRAGHRFLGEALERHLRRHPGLLAGRGRFDPKTARDP